MTAALILTSASHTIACASCNAPWPLDAAQCPGCGLREEAPVATQVVAPSPDAPAHSPDAPVVATGGGR